MSRIPWKNGCREKEQRHNKGSARCLPFCITTSGAIDPISLSWLSSVTRQMADRDRAGWYSSRSIIRRILHRLWSYNYKMYRGMYNYIHASHNSIIHSLIPPD